MLELILTVILAILNIGIALYVLKNAKNMFKNKPKWLNTFIQEESEGLIETVNTYIDNKIGQFLQPDEEGNNFIDLLAQRFGKGFRMSLLAQKSGEARHTKMIEGRVFNALKENSPELQLGLQVLDKFGLGDLATPENLPALLQIAQKYGIFGSYIGQNRQNPRKGTELGSA